MAPPALQEPREREKIGERFLRASITRKNRSEDAPGGPNIRSRNLSNFVSPCAPCRNPDTPDNPPAPFPSAPPAPPALDPTPGNFQRGPRLSHFCRGRRARNQPRAAV